MKKILSMILALAMVLCLLTGCGSSSSSSESSDTKETAATETVDAEETEEAAEETAPSSDEVYTMTVTTHENEGSWSAKYLNAWAEAVEESTDGRIVVDIYWSGTLAGATESYDAVLNGVADATWCAPNFANGVFPMSDVLALPFCGITSGPMGSAVAWDMLQNCEAIADEWSSFKVFSLHTNGATPIASTTPISSLEDLDGLRLRCGLKATISWAENFGIVCQSFPISDLYENLSKNVVDGAINDYQAIDSFNAQELLDTVLDCGITYAVSGIVMSWDFWNSLPTDLQETLDNECGGLDWNIKASMNWRESDDVLREEFEEMGINIVYPDQEMYDAMKAAGQKAAEEWVAEMEAEGYPAQEVYDQFLETIEKYADEYAEYVPAWYSTIEA